MSNRLADAFLAIRDHGWELSYLYGRPLLVPPETDERRSWCAEWDKNGLPHWLPKFTEGET